MGSVYVGGKAKSVGRSVRVLLTIHKATTYMRRRRRRRDIMDQIAISRQSPQMHISGGRRRHATPRIDSRQPCDASNVVLCVETIRKSYLARGGASRRAELMHVRADFIV